MLETDPPVWAHGELGAAIKITLSGTRNQIADASACGAWRILACFQTRPGQLRALLHEQLRDLGAVTSNTVQRKAFSNCFARPVLGGRWTFRWRHGWQLPWQRHHAGEFISLHINPCCRRDHTCLLGRRGQGPLLSVDRLLCNRTHAAFSGQEGVIFLLRGSRISRRAVNPPFGLLSDWVDRGAGEVPPTPLGVFVPLEQTVAQIPPIKKKKKNGLIKPASLILCFLILPFKCIIIIRWKIHFQTQSHRRVYF